MRYFLIQNEINDGRGRYLMTEIEKERFNPLRRKPVSFLPDEQWWYEAVEDDYLESKKKEALRKAYRLRSGYIEIHLLDGTCFRSQVERREPMIKL
jgi:hypothetical protein